MSGASDLFFKISSVISPFIAALLAALATYHFTIKAKRLDILYANKIPALKEIAVQLIELKKYSGGVIAYLLGNEFAGDYHPPGGALRLRGDLAHAAVMNDFFLSRGTKEIVDRIIQELGIVCNAEARFVLDPTTRDLQPLYERIAISVGQCMEALHSELYGKFEKR